MCDPATPELTHASNRVRDTSSMRTSPLITAPRAVSCTAWFKEGTSMSLEAKAGSCPSRLTLVCRQALLEAWVLRDIQHRAKDHFCTTQSQPARQAAPLGAPVPPLEKPFADLTGLAMGISMLPPVVGPGPPLRVAGPPNQQRRLLGAQTPNLLPDLLANRDNRDGHLRLWDCHAET